MRKPILIEVFMTFLFIFITLQSRSTIIPRTTSDTGKITLKYLGTAGWEITDGKVVILVDPYITRLRRNYSPNPDSISPTFPGDTRTAFNANDPLIPDTLAIDKYIKKADYILVHHSHRDHILDVPYIAQKTGANVIGHESTANVMFAYGIPEQQIITVKGGEDYEFGTFSIKVIPSLHSALDKKRHYDSRVISKDTKAPLRFIDYAEGGSLQFLIRIGGYTILTSGGMNYIEKELQGLRPDIAIVGANLSRKEIYDYEGRLMKVLNYPAVVLPTHWDNFNIPYTASLDDRLEILEGFKADTKKASPKTKVIIPKYFEPIALDTKRK
jgi:L-ascorbate metabolism protein UlaG (beta-lactamase superfamily)